MKRLILAVAVAAASLSLGGSIANATDQAPAASVDRTPYRASDPNMSMRPQHVVDMYGNIVCHSQNDAGVWFWGSHPNYTVAWNRAMTACRIGTPSYGLCVVQYCD